MIMIKILLISGCCSLKNSDGNHVIDLKPTLPHQIYDRVEGLRYQILSNTEATQAQREKIDQIYEKLNEVIELTRQFEEEFTYPENK